MPVFEPLTDGMKAFRELIRALQDLATLFGRFGHVVEQSRRRHAAKCLATLYFDPALIPSTLRDLAMSQSLEKDGMGSGHDDPVLDARSLTLPKRRIALWSLTHKLEITAYMVVETFGELQSFDDFLRERFGLSYYSAEGIKGMKGEIRQRLKQFAHEVDVNRLSESEIERELYDLQGMIAQFNQVVSDLHDRLLGIPASRPRTDASVSPTAQEAKAKKSGAPVALPERATHKAGRRKTGVRNS